MLQADKTVKKTLPVLEMSCASCAVNVENVLKQQPGVEKAAVNYANSSVSLEYFPALTSPEELKKAVQAAGYDLLVPEVKEGEKNLETIQEKHFNLLRRRTLGALGLSLPVAIVGMFFMDIPYAQYIMWGLSTPVVLWYGRSFFVNAYKQLRHHTANMDTLVALSTGVAYIFSVFNTLFPEFWHGRGLHAHVYFEAAAVVVTFILLGKLLEEKAKGNTSSALKKLIGLQPKNVIVQDSSGMTREIPIEYVEKGNIILVKPGDKIAVDGKVSRGETYVDESMISGEPMPVFKKPGEKVFSGTINQKGSILFVAEQVGSDTLLAQIIRMVQEAQGSKAPVQRLVDKVAAIFVPAVMIIALFSFITWWIFGGENGFSQGLLAMVTVLVIACPCALGLATPTAIMVGVGKGAENGILIKDAESLETAKKINTIILDKTGTITAGKPQVTDIIWQKQDPILAGIFYSIEKLSEHPLAEAVVNFLADNTQEISDFKSITGEGVTATAGGIQYFVGNERLLEENNIPLPENLKVCAETWGAQAKTVIWFADQQQALAILAITDKTKPTSAAAIRRLQLMGIDIHMLTGDNERAARAIAEQVGIKYYKSEVLPQDKADYIKWLQQQGKVVAMAGDGINDSAAMAQADVSIAMGKGSDIAMDVAHMTIISSDLLKIPQAISLSKMTVNTIRQNLFWAFIYNIIGIPIAAGILYPVNGFLLNPMIAGAAMALSSVSVVSNSLRLKWKKL